MLVVYGFELAYFIITTVTYIFVLSILWRGWKSKTASLSVPFFKLCFVTGILDILTLLNNNIGNVLPKACVAEGFYRFLGPPYLHLYFVIAWGGGVCQGCCVIVIALNRFFTLLYPRFSLKAYNSHWIIGSFAIQIIPGIIAASFTLGVTVDWWQDDYACALVGWIVTDENGNSITRTYFSIAAVFLVITAIIIIGLYSIILINIRATHKQQLNQANTTQGSVGSVQFKRESRLLTMSLIICAVQVFYTFYLILRELTGIDENYIGLTFLSDLCAGTNAYLLIAFSKPIRYHFKKQLKNVSPNIVKVRMNTQVPVPRSPHTTVVLHS